MRWGCCGSPGGDGLYYSARQEGWLGDEEIHLPDSPQQLQVPNALKGGFHELSDPAPDGAEEREEEDGDPATETP